MPRHAYTLVEVLAVTVLLGLVASLAAPPLLRAITGDPLTRAAGRLAQSFRDVRARAYGHRLVLELEPWGFSAATVDDGAQANPAATRLPETVLASWSRGGQPTRRLELDGSGHGPDTEVVLRQDERELRFAIDGLTGAWDARNPP